MSDPLAASSLPNHHLFVVRMWWEAGDGGAAGEWRGSVEHVPSGEKRYFRDCNALPTFITARLAVKDENESAG